MTKLESARFLAWSFVVCAGLAVGSIGCKTAQNENTGGAGGMLSSFPTGNGTSSQLPSTGSGGGSSIVSAGSGGVAAGTGGVAAGTGGVAAGTGGVGTGGVGTGGVGTGGVGTGGMGTGGMGTGGMGTGGMGTGGGAAGMGASDPCTTATVAKMVPMACAACACSMKPTEAMACSADANCWALIACIRDMCMANSMDTTCIITNCASSVGGQAPATAIGPTLTGACMTQCAASH